MAEGIKQHHSYEQENIHLIKILLRLKCAAHHSTRISREALSLSRCVLAPLETVFVSPQCGILALFIFASCAVHFAVPCASHKVVHIKRSRAVQAGETKLILSDNDGNMFNSICYFSILSSSEQYRT